MKRPARHPLAALAAAPLALALALAGCATAEQSGAEAAGAAADRTDATAYQAAVAKAESLAAGEDLADSLEYVGPNGGAEGQVLQSVYAAFTEATGTKVNYTGTQDINSVVQSRVQAGNAPAVADLSLGVAQDYARQGLLMDLTEVIGQDQLSADYSRSLLDGASHDGAVFGVYQGFSNFMLWYNPTTYTGPQDPGGWQEVSDWSEAQAEAGTPVWCLAEEAGGSSGFPGAQFIETLFAKKHGPEKLRQWGSGELAWTSPEVQDAWRMFGQIATDDTQVSGGVRGALSAPIATGYNGLVSEPATCQVALWGSWVPGLIGAQAEPGENLDFLEVPGSDPQHAGTEIFQSTVAVAFQDDPTTRAFMRFIESTEAQTLLASADQWPVANVNVPTDTYDSVLLRKAAETYFGDDVDLAVGPNVLADAAVSAAFYKGVVSYLQDPGSLDRVLAGIQAAADGS